MTISIPQIIVSYAHFFAGEIVDRTGIGSDAELFYSWFVYKF